MEVLDCSNNPLTSLTINNLVNLIELYLADLNPAAFPLNMANSSNFPNLTTLVCYNTALGSIPFNVSAFPALGIFTCRNIGLTGNLAISNPHIYAFYCENNSLTSINLSGLPALELYTCWNNQLTTIDLSHSPLLITAGIGGNPMTSIDASLAPSLASLSVYNSPNLVSVNVKNGIANVLTFNLCPNIQYICGDNTDINGISNNIATYGYTNCHKNTYCSFTPGGVSYAIEGNNRFDSNNNGCDIADLNVSNLKLNFTNGTITGSLIGTAAGNYHNDVPAGTHTLTPVLENPSYFTVSPTTANVLS